MKSIMAYPTEELAFVEGTLTTGKGGFMQQDPLYRGWGMAIDAHIWRVDVEQDGSGTLHLEPREADAMGPASPPGQTRLRFLASPRKVHSLQGKNIWGGTGDIHLGTRKIADRAGYEMLVFVDEKDFDEAIKAYKWTTHPETR